MLTVVKKIGSNMTNNLIDINIMESFGVSLNDNDDYCKIQKVSPLVASIDLYSDTFIGEPQKDVYISEFKKIQDANIDNGLTMFCGEIIRLLAELEMPGEYLVFVGD
jgi:hypothetical protein